MATWGELEKAGTKWRDLEEMTWGELEEFCVINPKTKQIPDDMEVSFVPMQSVSDTGAVQTDEVRKASEVKKGFTFFEEGDVLFAKITPCMENGKGGIARGLKNGVGFGSTEFHVLHPDPEKVSSKWLYYLTSWDEFRKQCARNMTGSAGQKRVPKSYLEHYKVHLPPLDEQRRTAAVLDKVSDLIAKRREQLDKLDELVKARFVEMFGEPIANPMKWPVVPLKSLSTLITNGNTPKGGSENYVENGITFLRSQNVWRNQIILDDVAYIDEATHRSMKKSSLRYKDILITKTGRINTENSSLGRAALFLGKDDSANINGHVYLVRLKNTAIPEYIVTILTGEAYRKYIRKVCVGGIDKRQINVEQVEDFPIILPPIEMQKSFSTIRKEIGKSKLTIQQSLGKLEVLKKALMQQYFG